MPPYCSLKTIAIGVVMDFGSIVMIVSYFAPNQIAMELTLRIAARLPINVAVMIATPRLTIKS